MLFTRAGLEQASAEPSPGTGPPGSPGARLADLCCGIGGDLIALAGPGRGPRRRPGPGAPADGRAQRRGLRRRRASATAGRRRPGGGPHGGDAVFVDPARRAGGRRTGPGDGEPPLAWCVGLAERVPAVAVKAAPGLPRAAVPPGWEVEFVADGARPQGGRAVVARRWPTAVTRATVLPRRGHELLPVPGQPRCRTAAPGEYLLDPNPAVTRAGLVEELARRPARGRSTRGSRSSPATAAVATPFARTLRVLDSAPWEQKAARPAAAGAGRRVASTSGAAGWPATCRTCSGG